jgi:hypothetical protein
MRRIKTMTISVKKANARKMLEKMKEGVWFKRTRAHYRIGMEKKLALNDNGRIESAGRIIIEGVKDNGASMLILVRLAEQSPLFGS